MQDLSELNDKFIAYPHYQDKVSRSFQYHTYQNSGTVLMFGQIARIQARNQLPDGTGFGRGFEEQGPRQLQTAAALDRGWEAREQKPESVSSSSHGYSFPNATKLSRTSPVCLEPLQLEVWGKSGYASETSGSVEAAIVAVLNKASKFVTLIVAVFSHMLTSSAPTAACFVAFDVLESRLVNHHEIPRTSENSDFYSAVLTKAFTMHIQTIEAELLQHHKALQSLSKSVERIKPSLALGATSSSNLYGRF
ncbi:hypothetical protein FB451DRAFT_1177976 [Mycena latifolia]|nr:hypothetical protein FB451DRAFT_1177976 [Mycena latifolia]